MEQRCRRHWHATAFELAMVDLVLIIGFLDLWPNITWSQQVVEVGVDYLSYDFNDSATLWEMPDRIDVDVDTFFFSLFPKFCRRILLVIVRNKLCRVLTLLIRI